MLWFAGVPRDPVELCASLSWTNLFQDAHVDEDDLIWLTDDVHTLAKTLEGPEKEHVWRCFYRSPSFGL